MQSSSTCTKQDGGFRKIQVRLKKTLDAKVASREGYYADRDFDAYATHHGLH